MESTVLYSKIEMLPDNLKEEVNDFVSFLLQKINKSKKPQERQFGAFKGMITISPDFDAPLEDFNDYM